MILINEMDPIDSTKTITEYPGKKSRLEVNIRMLLKKCELMAKVEAIEDNYRLKKYVQALNEMLEHLKFGNDRPKDEVLADYKQRAKFLNSIIKTANITSPLEKLDAFQHISRGTGSVEDEAAAQEIHQRAIAKYGKELRSELFGTEDADDSLRKRNIIKSPNFKSVSISPEETDTVLKYHQNMQESVTENMVILTKNLKEQSEIANTIIKRDTAVLQKSTTLTDRNLDSLKKESTRLQEHSRSAWKCWLWVMLVIVMVIFVNMVMFMKVMKKKQ